jgi:hypothetical protein
MNDNDWIGEFEKRAGPRLRLIFEKDLDGMPSKLEQQLERLRNQAAERRQHDRGDVRKQ